VKKIIPTLITAALFSACSSTPDIGAKYSAAIQQQLSRISLNGVLKIEKDQWILSPWLTAEKIAKEGRKNTLSWSFNGKTLFPNFYTTRFECEVSANECDKYEDTESPFLKVNGTQSDYGDTYSQRVADGKKPIMTSGQLQNTIILAVVAPAVASIAVMVSPFVILGGTANLIKGGSIYSKKWVEFDHDNFYETVQGAIVHQHGSIDNYVTYMAKASTEFAALNTENETQLAKLSTFRTTKINEIEHDVNLNPIVKYKIKIASSGDLQAELNNTRASMTAYYLSIKNALIIEYKDKLRLAKANSKQQQIEAYESAQSIYELNSFIETYRHIDLANLVTKAKAKWSKMIIKEQKLAFNNIKTIADAKSFIAKYKVTDKANLVTEAQKLINDTENKIRKEQEKKRQTVLTSLNSWRKSLQVGHSTFCGRIIEVNYPMFKIALDRPLQNFSSAIWLHKDKIFERWSGCRNTNNKIIPNSNPLI